MDNTAQHEVRDTPHPVLQDLVGVYRPITVDNRSTPILCNSNRPALGPLARKGSSSYIRSRRQAALDLGSRVFHKPWLKTAVPATRRMFRVVFSDELQLLESLLTEIECAPSRDHSQFGYRVQKHVLEAVFNSLKLTLHRAAHNLRITATCSPMIPTWGNDQRTDEFHSLDDLELLGICFRAEVEHFLVQLDTVHLQARGTAPTRTESFSACTIPATNNAPSATLRSAHLNRHPASASLSPCGVMPAAVSSRSRLNAWSRHSPQTASVYQPGPYNTMPSRLAEILAPTHITRTAYTTAAYSCSDSDSSSDSPTHSDDETPLSRDFVNYSDSDLGSLAEVHSDLASHDDSQLDLASHDDSESDLAYHDDSESDLAYHDDSDIDSDANSDVNSEVSSGHDSDSD
ncbi:hypothetical protein GGX14DRAFT_623322 [Mycena pura]|uniref:Uncharacterized protein n=1 Tax=Mycena pura TaxID=153505 RepID=A0AAD6VHL9_9AGAR|nr:hypothetical protein GGX14DRAFT_623322 [Mycena pura]